MYLPERGGRDAERNRHHDGIDLGLGKIASVNSAIGLGEDTDSFGPIIVRLEISNHGKASTSDRKRSA